MKAIFCYNYSKFFISHRLPMLMKIKKEFSEISFLGHILEEDVCIINKSIDKSYDTRISKGSMNVFFIIHYLFSFMSLKFTKIGNFDLIEIATLKGLVFSIPLLLVNKNAKVVIWVCGIGTIFISKKIKHKILIFLFFALYRIIYRSRRTSWIFENNDDMKLFRKKIKINESDYTVIGGSGYEKKQASKINLKENLKKNKIVFIGRLIKDKGLIEFIKAAKIILEKNNKWKFEIIGDYDDNPSSLKESDLKKHIGKYQIVIKGFISNMDDYYEEVYCVVLPSYREGLSRVLIEAGAHSIPSITTNVPGCRDIIINNLNGLIVEPKSIDELKDSIHKLISNTNIASKMGKKAHEIFNEKYSLDKISKATLGFYLEKS